MKKHGANMLLADPHRVYVDGPTKLHRADIEAPPALRERRLVDVKVIPERRSVRTKGGLSAAGLRS